jgi:hypothetical protein
MPIGSDFGAEISLATEGFAVKELVFDGAVDRFDIALSGVTLGRDVTVVTTQCADGAGRPCSSWLLLRGMVSGCAESHMRPGIAHRTAL